MRQAGIMGAAGRPKWRHTKPENIAGDLVERNFARSGPNQLWVTDITEHRMREGKIYCCVVLDAYSRRVVGWSIDASFTAALVTNALGMAIGSRRPAPGTLIHSDHGVQFRSRRFVRALARHRMVGSMGRVGAAGDNAAMESFFGSSESRV